MRTPTLQLLAAVLALAALAGCSTSRSCFDSTEYLAAVERPPLKMPQGVPGSERLTPLVIPPADANPQKLDPQPRCLDEPPAYFAKQTPLTGKPAAAPADKPAAAPADKPADPQ
jgi:hypothetical protein